jgi:hypothetical protein
MTSYSLGMFNPRSGPANLEDFSLLEMGNDGIWSHRSFGRDRVY